MKNIIIKLSSLTLAFILILFTLCACTPQNIENEMRILDGCCILNCNSSKIIANDDFGRKLGVAKNEEVENQDVYVVLQSYYDKDEKTNLTYKKGNYYFFDYECKGQESEEFQQFLEDNLWNSPIKASNEQLLYGLQKEDTKMIDFRNNFRWDYDVMNEYANNALKHTNIKEFAQNSFDIDGFQRVMYGINTPPKIAGNPPKLYALMFQATTNSACYYLADRCVAEIRLDHYVEDLEAFKKANNWDEPLTVEDLNAMDKYVVSGSAK